MARTIQITFDAASPRALGLFWLEVLEYAVDPPPGDESPGGREETIAAWMEFLERAGVPEERRDDAFAIIDPTGAGPRIFFQRVPEPKIAKNRVHIDVRAALGLRGAERMTALETEAARLIDLGATLLDRVEPGDLQAGFLVMTDPEGNEFCLD